MLIAYTALYLAFTATAARAIIYLWRDKGLWYAICLLGLYLLSLLLEPVVIPRKPVSLHVFNALQAGIGLMLLLGVSRMDFFSLLFIPPCALSMMNLPFKIALYWIGVIGLAMEVALLAHFPFQEGISYAIIYPTAIFLFTGLIYLALEAEKAQDRSEALLEELKTANRKLQEYAEQVEELVTVKERNRLARELHDSVTQIIFGLTLSAQAARILLVRDPSRVAAQLDHMQELAQKALAEMRSLIQQMHQSPTTNDGLANRLHRLVEERRSTDGLEVELKVDGDQHLPSNVEEGLYRITQEALNNIVKHAQTSQAVISVQVGSNSRLVLCIEDHGVGFDPARTQPMPGHLGLTSISERVQALGGSLLIDSQPGRGTRLTVELSLDQEMAHGS
jgi:signal transduction histidine kinase